jgi:hypothetical protein
MQKNQKIKAAAQNATIHRMALQRTKAKAGL